MTQSGIWRSLWRRHWLEIRGGLLVAAIAVAILCLVYPLLALLGTSELERTGRIAAGSADFASQLQRLSPEGFLSWRAHAWLLSVAVLLLGLAVPGTGIRTNNLQAGHPSLVFTLTLPVSRFDLIWTRFAASCAATFPLLGAMLIANSATALLLRHSVPLAAMAASSFLAALLAMVVIAVIGLLMLWNERALPWVVVALVVGIRWTWPFTSGFLAIQSVPWSTIGTVLLVVGGALCTSAVVAHKKDF